MAAPERPRNAAAVMASRKLGPDSLDFFPTHPWAGRALCHEVLPLACAIARSHGVEAPWDPLRQSVLEPAAGTGDLVRGLRSSFGDVTATDLHNWPATKAAESVWNGEFRLSRLADFLDPHEFFRSVDWVVTNPPFNQWRAFAERAQQVARRGVALFLRLQWLETGERYDFCRQNPPLMISSFAERVPLAEGRLHPKAGTATAYIWVVWIKGWRGLVLPTAPGAWDLPPQRDLSVWQRDLSVWHRIGYCRDRLIHSGDYDAWQAPPGPLLELAAERGSPGGGA